MKKIFKDLNDKLTREEKKSQYLISMIRNLPDANPPEGLVERVMGALPSPKTIPWWLRLYRLALTPQTVSFTPLKLTAATICCALALFIVALWIDTNNSPRYTLNGPDVQSPEASYHMGRYLLSSNQPAKALPYLAKAVALSPGSAEFHFWLGVAHWALMDFDEERRHYIQAIALDPEYIPANLYLGHNFIDRGEWEKALAQYDRVLAIDSTLPDALYNRGLALKNLGRTAEEIIAWKQYLKVNQRGKWAVRAAHHLNARGGFSYGIHQIGAIKMVIKRPTFDSSDVLLPESLPSLGDLGNLLEHNQRLYLHVVVYFKENRERAFARAKSIKRYLTMKYPNIAPGRVKLSWFASAEKVEINDTRYLLDESVRFIGQTEKEVKGGDII